MPFGFVGELNTYQSSKDAKEGAFSGADSPE
jgi:hypothetical protein